MDWVNAKLESIAIMLGLPPWMVIVTLVFIVVLFMGVGLVVKDRAAGSRGYNWRRDPDDLPDISPQLRRARLQMLGAALAMVAVLILAIANLLTG